jgi:hypothetical protein
MTTIDRETFGEIADHYAFDVLTNVDETPPSPLILGRYHHALPVSSYSS